MASRVDVTDVISEFKNGTTQDEIGAKYGVSRAYIQQICSKHGLGAKDGGKHVKSRNKMVSAYEEAERRHIEKTGMTRKKRQEIEEIWGKGREGPYGRFSTQRKNAAQRGIEWKFTFSSWWAVWEKSGKWSERGRSGYVMARKGDDGPYSHRNVEISTSIQNGIDATINRPFDNRKYKNGRLKKLTFEAIWDIRDAVGTNVEVGKRYGVNAAVVSRIRSRKGYKWIPERRQ